jgi:ANTAR domain
MSVRDGADVVRGDEEQQRITDAVTVIMERRQSIQQAAGMLMLIYDLEPDHAFEMLKWLSQNENVKLRTLAEELISDLPALARDRTGDLRNACDKMLLTRRGAS